MTYNFGFGKLSAGTLDVALGGKSFGVLGQGPVNSQTAGSFAVKLPQEDSNNCINSYMAITAYFKGAGSSFKLKTKAYDWRSDIDFTIPQTPAEAVHPDYPAYLADATKL